MKKINNIKKYLFLAIFSLLFTVVGQSQGMKTAYFIDNTPLRLSMNPAFRPAYGYINIPAIGNIGLNLHTSLALDNVLFPHDGKLVTFLDPRVSYDDFFNKVKENNTLNINADISLLGFGFYTKNIYWTFNVNLNVDASANIPGDLFEFIKKGNGVDGSVFDISNIKLNATSYLDASLGMSLPIGEIFTFGVNVKFLTGLVNANVWMDNLSIKSNSDQWKIDSDGFMNTNIGGFKINEDGEIILDANDIAIAGMGAAIDIGLTARPIKGLLVSAAVTDLGFIKWNKKTNTTATANNSFLFEGFQRPIDEPVSSMGQIGDDLGSLIDFEMGESVDNIQMITASFNLGAEYSILKDKIGFGLLYTGKIHPLIYEQELTLSTTFRPKHWFSAAFSYSFLNANYDSFGFVLNFSPTWINLFIGTDYLFTKVTPNMIPYSQSNLNVYLGISIPIGVRKARMAANAARINKSVYDL